MTATNVSGASLIPPAFGLAGVNLHTWSGWGSVPRWNAFVANLEMHGKGRFWDPRLNNPPNSLLPPPMASGIYRILIRTAIAFPPSFPRFRFISWPFSRRSLPPAVLTPGPLSAAMLCLAAKRNATAATSNRSGPTPVGTCIPLRRCASTVFRPTAPPITTTALRPSATSSRTRRAALTTTLRHAQRCRGSLQRVHESRADLIRKKRPASVFAEPHVRAAGLSDKIRQWQLKSKRGIFLDFPILGLRGSESTRFASHAVRMAISLTKRSTLCSVRKHLGT